MPSTKDMPWRLTVSQRWAGAPTSAVCLLWHADAPQLQFTAHGASGGVVVLHGLQACQSLQATMQRHACWFLCSRHHLLWASPTSCTVAWASSGDMALSSAKGPLACTGAWSRRAACISGAGAAWQPGRGSGPGRDAPGVERCRGPGAACRCHQPGCYCSQPAQVLLSRLNVLSEVLYCRT